MSAALITEVLCDLVQNVRAPIGMGCGFPFNERKSWVTWQSLGQFSCLSTQGPFWRGAVAQGGQQVAEQRRFLALPQLGSLSWVKAAGCLQGDLTAAELSWEPRLQLLVGWLRGHATHT